MKHHADKATITFRYADGSMGTLHYLGNGSPAFPKERLEVFVGGRILQLDNFRSLRGWGFKGFGRKTLRKQDKGHSHAIRAFLSAVQSGGDSPIPFEELIEVSRISMEIEAAGRGPGPVE